MADREIARFTAEQTAAFLAGGDLGRPDYTDPEVAASMEHQRQRLRLAWNAAVGTLYQALVDESPSTAVRLLELKDAALVDGDPEAKRLLTGMLGELLHQALAS